MFNASLPTIANTWKELKCPLMNEWIKKFSSVQFSSVTQSCLTLQPPWTAACQAFLSINNSQSLLKLMSVESVMPSNHLILHRPFSSCLPSFPASGSFPISQFFASGGQSLLDLHLQHLWMNHLHSLNEYSGLISFRIDLLDLLAVQGTLKSLLQHHSSKASIL